MNCPTATDVIYREIRLPSPRLCNIIVDDVDDALDEEDQPHNKREEDDEEGWVVDDDVYTDGGPMLGFFDASQPHPYDNSRRVWYVDDPHVERSLVKTEDSAVGFYALNGQSMVSWKETKEKEWICEVLAVIRKQNPGKRILLVLDKHGSHICEYTRKCAHQLGIDLIFLPSSKFFLIISATCGSRRIEASLKKS